MLLYSITPKQQTYSQVAELNWVFSFEWFNKCKMPRILPQLVKLVKEMISKLKTASALETAANVLLLKSFLTY